MEFLVKYIVIFLVGLVGAWVLVPLAKRLAPALGLLDEPSERRIHSEPIPRCGGLALFAAMHIALLLLFFGPWKDLPGSTQIKEWAYILAGSTALLLLGLFDDRSGIRAWLKLAGQLAVALLMFFGGFTFQAFLFIELPWIINLLATLFWFTLLINAFNLIDGIDGACAGLGLIASAGLAGMLLSLGQISDALVLLALAGACLGFLRYNFNPASVFLGDCGSMLIGFLLAAVSLKANVKQSMVVALLVPLLAVGVPVFDVIMAVWRRLARKIIAVVMNDPLACKVFGPDLDHIHHKLLRSGMTQRRAAISLYAAAVFACLVALGVTASSSHQTALLMGGMIIGLHFIVRQLAQVELWTSTQAVLLGVHRPRNIISLFVAVGWDVTCLLAASMLVFDSTVHYPLSWAILAVCTLIPIAAIYFYGVYKTVWTRSRISQLLVLMLQLAAGEVLAFIALVWIIGLTLNELMVALALHYMVAAFGIIGGRGALRVVRDLNAWLRCSINSEHDFPTLILGAGENAILYLRQASFAEQQKAPRKIVGLIDDNPALYNKVVYGYPVLGTFDQLEEIISRYGVKEIIFTHRYSDELREQIFNLKERDGLLVRDFAFFLRDLDRGEVCLGILRPDSATEYNCCHEHDLRTVRPGEAKPQTEA